MSTPGGAAVSRPSLLVSLLAEDQEYQRLQADDARTAAARYGFAADVVFAHNSAILQIQQLYRAIHQPSEARPAAIVVETVVGEGLERVARAAAQAGIGWVLINRRVSYLEKLRLNHPGLPISNVGTDQLEVGRLQARQFRTLIGSEQGVILYLQGPPDTSAAQERRQGTTDGLAGTRIELRVLDGDWTEGSGERAIERWLRLKTSEGVFPDLVGCQNDAMAVGAGRALARFSARPDLARLPRTGCDGLQEGGRRLVDMRQLAATVITPPNTGPAVALVARALKTGQPAPPEILLPPTSYPALEELAGRQAVKRG
jgi:ABC-type sugar transport system substrate-binding protein